MFAIYKKELKSYFTNAIGFVFLAFFLVITGIYFVIFNLMNQIASYGQSLGSVVFVFVILVPILTMRVMAEENRQKTDQLLYTSPISVTKIILGKYLAIISLFGIAMLVTCICPLVMRSFGSVSIATDYSTILGFFMMGAAYMAIGLFISSLTESQVIAAVVSFVVMLFTYLMTSFAKLLPNDNLSVWLMTAALAIVVCIILHVMMRNMIVTISFGIIAEAALAVLYFVKPAFYDGLIIKIMAWFSVVDRFESFQVGLLDLTPIVYYISVSFFFVFLTIQRIKKKRYS